MINWTEVWRFVKDAHDINNSESVKEVWLIIVYISYFLATLGLTFSFVFATFEPMQIRLTMLPFILSTITVGHHFLTSKLKRGEEQ